MSPPIERMKFIINPTCYVIKVHIQDYFLSRIGFSQKLSAFSKLINKIQLKLMYPKTKTYPAHPAAASDPAYPVILCRKESALQAIASILLFSSMSENSRATARAGFTRLRCLAIFLLAFLYLAISLQASGGWAHGVLLQQFSGSHHRCCRLSLPCRQHAL